MKYFYARVSTKEQNLQRQLNAVPAGISEVFTDKQSGKNFDRPEYQRLKSVLVSGDELYVKELDRLGRNKELIKDELRWFREHGVTVRILNIPTTLIEFGDQEWVRDMITNILVEVLGSMAEQERETTRRRQREGIDAMAVVNGVRYSTSKGTSYGRPAITIPPEYRHRVASGELSVTAACQQLGISRSKWYA